MFSAMKSNIWDSPEYWENLAKQERAFAQQERKRRTAPVESIFIHERNARDYDERAKQLRATRVP